jgi:glycerol-3-phosphate dehydrogenase (NAD(P)+)
VKRLAVIGGGAWGTALAMASRRAGSEPVVWARNANLVAAINNGHENPCFLPGVVLDPSITATTEIKAAIGNADAVLLVVPAQMLRSVLETHRHVFPPGLPLLHCAKGIESRSLAMMSEVGCEVLPGSPFAVLSGPSFALEVARDMPTAVAIAAHDGVVASAFAAALGGARFRPYLSRDPVGAQIGGAVKNVIAIASGIVHGFGLGENARAALITRGLAEMARLGAAMGARPETFQGLSGFGDLVLTCTTAQSRNLRLGLALGRGQSLASAISGHVVVEGVATAAAVARLAWRYRIEMPISEAVASVLHDGVPIGATIDRLLRRPYRSE